MTAVQAGLLLLLLATTGCAMPPSDPAPDASSEPTQAVSPSAATTGFGDWRDTIGATRTQEMQVVVAASWYRFELPEGSKGLPGNQGEHCGTAWRPGEPLRLGLHGPEDRPGPNALLRNWTGSPQVTWTDSADSLTQLDFAANGTAVPMHATFWPFHVLANVTFAGGAATVDGAALPWQARFDYGSRDGSKGGGNDVPVTEWLRLESLGRQTVTLVQQDLCM